MPGHFVRYASSVLIPAVISTPLTLFAQEGVVTYCQELKRVAELATTKDRFAWISGKAREEDFREKQSHSDRLDELFALWRSDVYVRF